MKRFTPLALVVLALAVTPAALADDGGTPTRPATESTAPAAQQDQQRPALPAQDPARPTTSMRPAKPGANLRHRVHMFVRHCVARTGATPERCLERVKKILERLNGLDDKLQTRIGKIQERCGASSAERGCKHADDRVERLTKLDSRVQKLRDKVQGWLDGKGASAGDEAGLDHAAGELGQLAGSNG